MDEKGRMPLAVGVLALFALLLRGLGVGPAVTDTRAPAASPPGREESPRAKTAPEDVAVCLLREFLGSGRPEEPGLRIDEPPRGPVGGYAIESLIALMPHPTRSRLSAAFDAHAQAIQRGLEEAGYLLDRYWLPWSASLPGDSSQAREARTPCGQPASESAPGVMLFRKRSGEERTLMVVALVAESPRSGVEAPALLAALRFAAWAEGSRPPEPDGAHRLRILGPTFSGSVDSLKRALASWLGGAGAPASGDIAFEIVSGTLTDSGSAAEMRSTADYPARAKGGLAVDFSTTVHSDDFVQSLFFNYLQNRNRARPGKACPTDVTTQPEILEKVALLVESSTAYGRSILDTRRSSQGEGEGRTAARYLKIPVPMHIGQLRAEWNKAVSSSGSKQGKGDTQLEIPLEVLDLPAEEAHTGQDVVPSFSDLTSRVDNLVLAQILPALTRSHIEYVGLVATDVQDRLFLGKMVRRYCPDVTLFALGSDLVYTHPQYSRDLEGMLLASTYPLFTANQVWTYPHQGQVERLQFPTNEAQGVFNAALALLGRADVMLEYGLPMQAPDVEGHERQPPVWVSAVGRNGVWPVAALCRATENDPIRKVAIDPILFQPEAGASGPTRDDSGHPGHPGGTTVTSPTFFKVYALAFVLLCVLHAAAYFAVMGSWRRWGLVWRLFRVFQPSRDPDHAFVQRLYLFGSFLVLSLVYAWISVPLALRVRLDLVWDPWIRFEAFVLLCGWLALLVPMIDIALWCRSAVRNVPGAMASFAAMVLALAPLGLLVTTVAYAFGSWTDFAHGTPVERAWIASFYLRATSLGSGLSPLLPLLFLGLAFYLWSLCELRRLHLAESADDHSLISRLAGAEGPGLADLKQRADGLVEDSYRNLRTCFVVLGVFTLFFWYTLSLLPSIDGRYFVGLFEVLLFFITVAITFEFARFVLSWGCLKAMLRRFAWLPGSQALKRMPVLISSEPVLDLARARPSLGTLRVAVELWGTLASAWRTTAPGARGGADEAFTRALGPDLDEARAQLEGALRAEVSAPWQVEDDRRSLQRRVNAAQLATVAALEGRHAAGSRWREAAEDFLAMGIVAYVRCSLAHLRNLLGFATGASLLVLLAISSYPFQPAHLLLALSWVVILTLVAVTVFIFVQMDRDEVLSWLSKSTPGHLVFSREFLFRIGTYGVVPILGVAAAQFPEVGRALFFWVEPFLNALK